MVPRLWHPFSSPSRISERIVGDPVEIGARTIRPVVRVSGWRFAEGDSSDGSAGVRTRGEPEAVIILERDGREHRVPTPDGTRPILWRMAGVALMVAAATRAVVRIIG